MILGGCFCGQCRYQIQLKEPSKYQAVDCHCSICRKTSAAPYVSWVEVPKASFQFTQGQAKLLNSSSWGQRYFCQDCGTPMAFTEDKRPKEIDITVCSLDKPEDFPPKRDVHAKDKIYWLKN